MSAFSPHAAFAWSGSYTATHKKTQNEPNQKEPQRPGLQQTQPGDSPDGQDQWQPTVVDESLSPRGTDVDRNIGNDGPINYEGIPSPAEPLGGYASGSGGRL